MATLKDIKRRISAVKSTKQITSAMKMVAAAKLRRAQAGMLELRPYADKMNAVIAGLSGGEEQDQHPLLAVRPPKVVEVLVISSDRGLCGAFNTNILKAATALVTELGKEDTDTVSGNPLKVKISIVGKKAFDYYKRRKVELSKEWRGLPGALKFSNAQEVAGHLIDDFRNEELDEVYVVYNEFKNVAQQIVRSVKLLPLTPPEPEEEKAEDDGMKAGYIYEPSEDQLLESLLPKNVEVQVYRALLESRASEEAARMMAMENATKAANEMIDTLTLQYNKARQASITAELMDIVGGVEALKD
jgi:F-type H+-transporting ATPase subunit gamma